ncbi:MAG TPA: hypothetical protein VIN32_03435 [Candidatus Limnocylindria bacterium]
MSRPRESEVLRQVAQRLAEVFAAAAAVVTRSEAEIRRHEEEAARVANVLGKADPASRGRVMSARRAAGMAELLAAQTLADEMRYQAGSRALAAVHRYAGTLAAEAEAANAIGRSKLAELETVFDGLDSTNARALLAVVEEAEAQRIANAERRAADLTAQIQAAMGSLPPPPVAFDVTRPRSGKARRRARRNQVEAQPQDAEADSADVVRLNPNRRRSVT